MNLNLLRLLFVLGFLPACGGSVSHRQDGSALEPGPGFILSSPDKLLTKLQESSFRQWAEATVSILDEPVILEWSSERNAYVGSFQVPQNSVFDIEVIFFGEHPITKQKFHLARAVQKGNAVTGSRVTLKIGQDSFSRNPQPGEPNDYDLDGDLYPNIVELLEGSDPVQSVSLPPSRGIEVEVEVPGIPTPVPLKSIDQDKEPFSGTVRLFVKGGRDFVLDEKATAVVEPHYGITATPQEAGVLLLEVDTRQHVAGDKIGPVVISLDVVQKFADKRLATTRTILLKARNLTDETAPAIRVVGLAEGDRIDTSAGFDLLIDDPSGVDNDRTSATLVQERFAVNAELPFSDSDPDPTALRARISLDATPLQDGAYTLKVTAQDSSGVGARITREVVFNVSHRVDTLPPRILFTSHKGEETVKGVITLSARADDSSGIGSFTVSDSAGEISNKATEPGQFLAQYNTAMGATGFRTLEGRAVDLKGNEALATLKLFVDNTGLPTVEVRQPAESGYPCEGTPPDPPVFVNGDFTLEVKGSAGAAGRTFEGLTLAKIEPPVAGIRDDELGKEIFSTRISPKFLGMAEQVFTLTFSAADNQFRRDFCARIAYDGTIPSSGETHLSSEAPSDCSTVPGSPQSAGSLAGEECQAPSGSIVVSGLMVFRIALSDAASGLDLSRTYVALMQDGNEVLRLPLQASDGSRQSWSLNTADPLRPRGNYALRLVATDRAGNRLTAPDQAIVIDQVPRVAGVVGPSVIENTTSTLNLAATDRDGDAVTFEKTTGPDWVTVSSDGTVTLAPVYDAVTTAEANRTYEVKARARDEAGFAGPETAFTVAVTNVNRAPRAPGLQETTRSVNEAVTLTLHLISPDAGFLDPDGDPVTFEKVSGPEWVSIAADGNLTAAPNYDVVATTEGTMDFPVEFRAIDSTGAPGATGTITLEAVHTNRAPRTPIVQEVIRTVDEGETLTFHLISPDGSAIDPDGDAVIYSVGGPSWTIVDPVTGVMTIRPTYDAVTRNAGTGSFPFTFWATDSLGMEGGGGDITLTVTHINRPPGTPTVENITSGGTSTDSLTVLELTLLSFNIRSVDPDGDPVSYSVVSGMPAGATFESVPGLFKWTPPAGVTDPTVAFRASDDLGATTERNFIIDVTTNGLPYYLVDPPNLTAPDTDFALLKLATAPEPKENLSYCRDEANRNAGDYEARCGSVIRWPSATDPEGRGITYILRLTKGGIGPVDYDAGAGLFVSTRVLEVDSAVALQPMTNYEIRAIAQDTEGQQALTNARLATTNDRGLVRWWRFDEGSGFAALDWSGTRLGEEQFQSAYPDKRPTWVPGISGTALYFDGDVRGGDSSNADFARLSIPTLDGDLTVEFWVKAPVQGWNGRMIELSSNNQRGLQLTLEPSGQVSVNDAGGPGRGIASMPHVPRLDDDRWHHFVVTRQGDEYRLYIDGLWVGVDWGTHPAYDAVTLAALITDSGFFKGVIDEVAIYNRALKEDEVRRSCRRSLPLEGGGEGGGGPACPSPKAPIIVEPAPGAVLPPTRAFVSWRAEVDALGQSVAGGVEGYNVYHDIDKDKSDFYGDDDDVIGQPLTIKRDLYGLSIYPDLPVDKPQRLRLRPLSSSDGTELPAFESTRLFSTDSSLRAWWKFEGDANDSAGTNHGVMVGGATTVAAGAACDSQTVSALEGQALCLNGRDNYVCVASPLFLSDTQGTMVAWVLSSVGGPIVGGYWSGGTEFSSIFMPGVGSISNINSSYTNPEGEFVARGGTRLSEGGWHMVVYTQSSAEHRLYVDGALESLSYPAGSSCTDGRYDCRALNLWFGGHPAGKALDEFLMGTRRVVGTFDMYLGGLMDEVMVLNRPLSSGEVRNLYCGLKPDQCP